MWCKLSHLSPWVVLNSLPVLTRIQACLACSYMYCRFLIYMAGTASHNICQAKSDIRTRVAGDRGDPVVLTLAQRN